MVTTDWEVLVVLQKTPRGEQEFRDGTRRLPQKVRAALILVNGRRSAAELAAMLPSLPVLQTLQVLQAGGYVAPVGDSAAPTTRVRIDAPPAAPGAGDGAGPPSRGPSGRPVEWGEQLRRVAIAQIEGLAGPAGAVIVQRLRGARRPGEVRLEIQRAAEQLELFIDPAVARLFADEMAERLRCAVLDGATPERVSLASAAAP